MRGKLVISSIVGILVILAIVVSLVVIDKAPASAQVPVLDSNYYGSTSTVVVSIFNPSWNFNPSVPDTTTLPVPVVVSNTAAGTTTPTSTYSITSMTETGVNTGIFTANVVLGVNLTTIAAGDTIKAQYGPNTSTATVANVVFKKDTATVENWFDIGQSPIIEVATASLTSNVDTLTLKVASTVDTIGITLTVTETTVTSGIYRGSFTLVSNAVTPAPGELRVYAYMPSSTPPGPGLDVITATLGKSANTAISDDVPPIAYFLTPQTDITNTQTVLSGQATDAHSGLQRVEVSIDNGVTWSPVFLSTAYPSGIVENWQYAWLIPGEGNYNLKVRAQDKVGNTSIMDAVATELPVSGTWPNPNWIDVDVVLATVRGKVLLEGRTDQRGTTVTLDGQATTTDSEGSFSFQSLPPGDFVLQASAPGFLSAQTPEFQVFAGETITLPDVTLLAGDFTGDGIIDIYDLVHIAINFNRSGPIDWPTP